MAYVFESPLARNLLSNDIRLGLKVKGHTVIDGTDEYARPWEGLVAWNGTGSSITKGAVLTLLADGDEETNPIVLGNVAASGTGPTNEHVVAMEDIAASAAGTFARLGWVYANSKGAGIGKDDFLKIEIADGAAGAAYFIEDGTKKAKTSVARAGEAGAASEGLILVNLLGRDNVEY